MLFLQSHLGRQLRWGIYHSKISISKKSVDRILQKFPRRKPPIRDNNKRTNPVKKYQNARSQVQIHLQSKTRSMMKKCQRKI